MNQTAVDWLVQYIHSEEYQKAFGQTYISIELVDQAKAMEKDQMKKLFEKHYDETGYISMTLEDAERYYNETYGNNTTTKDDI
jgi:hypothetical protein